MKKKEWLPKISERMKKKKIGNGSFYFHCTNLIQKYDLSFDKLEYFVAFALYK